MSMKGYKILSCVIVFLLANQLQIAAQTTLANENKEVDNLDGIDYVLSNNVELTVTNPSASTTGSVDLKSDTGWLILTGVRPSEVIANHLSYITVDGEPAVYKTNLRVTNYLLGSVIMGHSENYKALSVFKTQMQSGEEMQLEPETYHKSAELGSFEDNVSSFTLQKGYMATFAENEDGTGASKVYIAEKETLFIDAMPSELDNNVSFIRVFPWRYSTKKGFGSGADFNKSSEPIKRLNGTWFYDWNHNNSNDFTDIEYVPMRWNARTSDDSKWQEIVNLKGMNHLLGFNEFDSADHANMSVDQMLELWPKMQESGLRLGSPAPAGLANGELYEFIDRADALGYRIDFVAIHLYSYLSGEQFYQKCKEVYDRTGRPIWVTEFNYGGHWNARNPVTTYPEVASRVGNIIERLEKEGIVERYAIFSMEQTFVNKAVYYQPEEQYNITPLGQAYKDQISTIAYDSQRSNESTKTNIALNKIATASSHHNNYTPNFAVDGISDTTESRWLVRMSTNPLPAWIEVDLEEDYTIDSYLVNESGNSSDFQLQYWDDSNSEWLVADDVQNHPDSRDYANELSTPFTASRVRLYITGHNRKDYIRLHELEIYGERAATASLVDFDKSQKIAVYPNPTDSNIQVSLKTNLDKVEINVVNALGQSILEKSYQVNDDKFEVNLHSQPKGIYFMIVKAESTQTLKIIKK